METPRNENDVPGQVPPHAPSKGTVRRSFSWEKKRRKPSKPVQTGPVEIKPEVISVVYEKRESRDYDVGFEKHPVTGDIIVSHVGGAIDLHDLGTGDCLLSIQGVLLEENGEVDNLLMARQILR